MGNNREIKSDGSINITSTQTNISGDLDVTGSINNFTFPGSDGLAGQALVTSGTGTLSFADSGSGGGSGKNYIENTRATTDVSGYATYADAAAATPVDGTGGSANITFTRNTTTPLRDGGDFKIAKDAVNRQGEGVGNAFTIDNADKSKKLIISFDYDASHAGYADDDIKIFVYDVTNTNLIRVNGEDLKAGKSKHYAQFQAASNSTSYRLIFHISSTNASAYDVFLDEISVGPQGIHNAAISERGVACKVLVDGDYTVSTDAFQTVAYDLVDFDTTGSFDTGTHTYTVPETGHYVINLNLQLKNASGHFNGRITRNGNSQVYGFMTANDDNRAGMSVSDIKHLNKGDTITAFTESVGVSEDSSYTVRGAASLTGGVATQFSIAKIGSQVTAGGGRDVILQIEGCAGSQSFANNTVTTVTDYNSPSISTVANMHDGTNFTAPESGYYDIHGQFQLENDPDLDYIRTNCYMQVDRKDGSGFVFAKFWRTDEKASGHEACQPYDINAFYLAKGQQIRFQLYQQNSDGDTTTIKTLSEASWLYISKRNSAQTILENETVAMRVFKDDSQSIPSASTTKVEFDDVDYDTHGTFNSSTNKYVVPTSGIYDIYAKIRYQDIDETVGMNFSIFIFVNNVNRSQITDEASANNQTSRSQQVADTLQLNKGDEIHISLYHGDPTSEDTKAEAGEMVLTIKKIK